MKTTREMKRKGFTLVELLIVIVVIGVLSAMMMLSSTEAVSSAKASNIVSNLRNLKTAALAWYADHLDDAEQITNTSGLSAKKTDIFRYMNNEIEDNSGYDFEIGSNAKESPKGWYVKFSTVDRNVAGKLAGRAGSVGLYGTADSSDKFVATDTAVYMYVR